MFESRRALMGCAAALLTATGPIAPAQPPDWKPVPGHIMTRWAKDVAPDKAWPEYPRPTMVREKWQNLNGLWEYSITGLDPAKADAWQGKILVPFPVESSLSGVGKILRPDQVIHCRRTFVVPAEWKGQRVLIHFGAVDWESKIRVNGKEVGAHKGGYDPFSFDITDALRDGLNEVVVLAHDPTDEGGQPRGKQWLTPHGIWYTPTSGIWQTVWLEPVPRKSIAKVGIEADRATGAVKVHVKDSIAEPDNFVVYEAEVYDGGRSLGKARLQVSPVDLKIASPKAWTPEEPQLYDVTIRTFLADKLVDEVKSYFAFREIKLGKDDKGINRLMLNGKPVFMSGPLDQGFWPDGLYTPPTDEAMKFDIEAVRKMGGNMLRKHVKVEQERFYYWCDRIGIMVWQDMPSPFFAEKGWKEKLPELTQEWKDNFDTELQLMIEARRHHPSIVMWVPFNEGWGQNDLAWAKAEVEKVKQWDPTRLVNCTSGWTDTGNGDVHDIHVYPGPGMASVEPSRASVLGEYGGLGLPLEGHTWVEKNNWGYVSYKNKEELTEAYVGLIRQLPMLIGQGLCAAVYTQTTDVEIECNGWLTYDREVWKIDPAKAAAASRALYLPPPSVTVIVPHAGNGLAETWRYTITNPDAAWVNAGFDDSKWSQGKAGFGTEGTPGAVFGTEWNTNDIWIRRSFDLAKAPEFPHLAIHHDEDADVFINGQPAVTLKGYTTGYSIVPLSEVAAKLLKPGKNTIAIHCHQTGGGQYIDCGLVDVGRAGH